MALSEADKSQLFSEIQNFCVQLRADYSKSKEVMSGIEDVYLMHMTAVDKQLVATNRAIALTKSTDERVAIQGIDRLLTMTVPEVSMPKDKNDSNDSADMIERTANALLASSDRVNIKPLHYDVTHQGNLHDLCVIRVTCTRDLLDAMEEGDRDLSKRKVVLSPIDKLRRDAKRQDIERLVQTTPFLLEPVSARSAYPVWHSQLGLTHMLLITNVRGSEILETYGNAREVMGKLEYNNIYELWDYTDRLFRCVWVNEHDPFVLDEHKLPFINYAATIVAGSSLADKTEDRFEPFLMTVYKSGLDQRKTEALTSTFTNSRVLGFSPMIRRTEGEGGTYASIDQDGLFAQVDVPKGGTWELMTNKGVVDPSTWNGLNIAQQLTEQATIFKSTLGQSQSSTYSQTALLSQLGRIPLETVRAQVGRCIADALEICFKWIKLNSKGVKVYNYRKGGALSELKPSDIPDYFNLKCSLEVSLPQDKLQQSTIASNLRQAGIVSDDYIQEEILGIGQPKVMRKQIIKEDMVKVLAQQEQQKALLKGQIELQQLQMQLEQMQQQGGPPVPPEGGAMQPETEELSPQGIPPEMMAGGMQGPETPIQEQEGGQMPPEGMPV